MKTIRFLHLSDLHRGSAWTSDSIGDYKDHSVSKLFAGSITASMETDFINSISNWQKRHGVIDAIICTGDLGDKGKADKIKEGVSFVNLIREGLSVPKENVLFCPGNHDADRSKESDLLFENYEKALAAYGFIDHRHDSELFYIKDIPFLVVNSSLGASEKNLFIKKYKDLVASLSPDEQLHFSDELKKNGMEYLEDCFDIPVVTNEQSERIVTALANGNMPFVVLLMHHGLLPCNSVEIRPYSSVIDGGRFLHQLMDTQKDVLLLHGHIHFPSSSVLYTPNSYCFISSVGVGAFNGVSGSTVNIIEVFCSDNGDHIITLVYEYLEQLSGLSFNKSYGIYNNVENQHFNQVLKLFESSPDRGISFSDLQARASCTEYDLLRVILSRESVFKVSRNQSDIKDWIIHRNF